MPLLEADSIGKSSGGRRVLASASLRAPAGSVTALVGANGAGKSTLLAVAAGWRGADTGIVRFDGVSYLSARLATLAACGMFYLPDREILSPGITLRRQLDAIRRRYGSSASVEAVAGDLGLSHCLDALPRRLSGGEMRRAELALAVIRRPKCLLADEPYRGISPLDAELITAVFRRLGAGGCAVVASGHEIGVLSEAADRVVWCADGTTVEYASPALAAADWRFQRGYLGRDPRASEPVRE